MNNTALLETLAAFTAAELNDFHRVVRSPYFNDGPYAADCIALWEHLRQYAPRFEHPDLELKRVYVRVFPGKSYIKGKMEVVMSKLHQIAKSYAAQLMAGHTLPPENIRLASFFRQRGLHKRASAILEKQRGILETATIHDEQYWQNAYWADYETHLLLTDLQNHYDHLALASAMGKMHHAHLTRLLTLLNTLFYTRRKSPVPYNFAEILAESVPIAMHGVDLEKEHLLRLLYRAFQFVRAPEEYGVQALQTFWQDLENHIDVLPREATQNLYTCARSHCAWHFNRGQSEFAMMNLLLFKSCFNRDLLFTNGKIQAATYLNMVQAALYTKDFDWLKHTMSLCHNKIMGVPDPEGLYQYTVANLYYHLQDYDKALEHLNLGSDDLYNNLMAKKLELKIYYETDSPLLDAKIENFKIFVFRQGKKNIADDVFQMNNHFIDFLRGMMNAYRNKAKAQKLLQKLDTSALVAERAWLKEKIEQMM